MAEVGPPDCETQKLQIGNLMKQSLKKGDTWYLVDIRWFKQWKKFVGFESWDIDQAGEDSANPGPIDNSSLLKEDNKTLKEHLVDDLDYYLLPAEAWTKLVAWYGTVEGQESISRKVIEQGMFVKHCKVEVYLLDLKLCENSESNKFVNKQFSRTDTIDALEKEMRRMFEISDEKDVRLWNRYMSSTYEHLNKPDNTLQDAGLYHGQVIVIEQKNEDGTWPRQAKSTSSYNSSHDRSYTTRSGGGYGGSSYDTGYNSYGGTSGCYNGYETGKGSAVPGVCGLANLGNTCFMNSSLQCMSNVPLLTEFMLSDRWVSEVNEDNPLGNKGEIARSYAELIKTMWNGKYSYTVPRNFKVAVGRFAPQFSGYQQQDSQELMAFLLDGLHEDLNRIRTKPYLELKDADGRPDEIVAKEAWDNYRQRNDSIIIDIFHGLLKSTVNCPDCDKISVTFDPFCYLSLPLPIKKERQMEVFWVPLASEAKPVQYKLTVPKMGSVADLCASLSQIVQVPVDKMFVTDVYNHRFHRLFAPDEGLNHVLDRDDIFVYEVPVNTTDDPEIMIVPIYLREKKSSARDTYVSSNQLFGQPLLLPVPRESCTYDNLYNILLERMSRYVRRPGPDDKWWVKSKSKVTNDNEVPAQCDVEVKPEKDKNESSVNPQETEEVQVNAESVNSMEVGNSDDELDNKTNGKMLDSEEDEEETREEEKFRRMFTFTAVNSYGSTELDTKLKDDGHPLKLTARTYVAVDWDPVAKEKFYDDKAAEDFEQDESMKNRNLMQKRQPIQLGDCLKLFTDSEKLSQHDPWYCPECKKHQQATKKFDLWSLPQILIIHLKRFSYNRYWRDKIDAVVEFPIKGLKLTDYILDDRHKDATYDLIAVSNHFGGLGGGHYTAFCKNKDDKEWYYFDDSSVSQSSEDAVVTKAAYVLVYERRVSAPESVVMKMKTTVTATGGSEDSTIINGYKPSDLYDGQDEMDTST
ncbi:ubiquitin carboxyl-terminal hydrolase 15-like isoform X2 [Gigantopelta aegis]|uniref:ubiquitin carboxyl-terminal hydrolase 15-like isoform X2 n=1 Tax=Gigantopelta aegis TaxID=1735272 RepID=UPI001B88E336|nr:ubiquitin carboxyl-terminal hydrolase 15-like isoform X2 [Gigantopelta aegis]